MYYFLSLMTVLVLSGCATIFKGTSETVHINSNPRDASVYLNGLKTGSASNPQIIKKGFDSQVVILKKEGYQDANLIIQKKFDPISILNVFFWPGFIIDAVSGAMMHPEQTSYIVELEKKK